MTRRTGIPTLMFLARRMCKMLSAYSGVITKLYPDNTALLAALAAANVACGVLFVELDAVRDYGD